MAVVIETTIGDITVDLYTQQRPQTCKNFLKLCKIKYYNFCLFHTVQANFIAQTGDPSGNGTGGESVYGLVYGNDSKYYEAEKVPKIKHSKAGLLSMVNCGNNMLGSQFFVTLGSDLQSLEEHCVFAEVTEGLDILSKLNEAICDHLHRPYQDIRITHTVILEDPFEDLPGLIIPPGSPEITQSHLANGRIGADEKINDEEGLTEAQLAEIKAEREAKARATILEIVGDLPDAEIAPPENVLFVCKLNPVTTDEDLEIIFSRFGKVKSCEVIRDHSSGDSLQYAFVEFDDRRSCEQAYLKMDNVLIDDRRIHVDFSQSVSKIKWRGKGRGVQYIDDDKKDGSRSSDKYGGKRDWYRERDRDRNPRRNEDDRRRRDEDYRRRDRRKENSNAGNRRRGEDGHDDRYDEDRKRRELRQERRREEERRYRREDRRRDDPRRRIDDKKRNGTDTKGKETKTKKTELKEKKEQKVEIKVDDKKAKIMEPPPKKEEIVETDQVQALPNNVPEKQFEVDTPDHASQSPSKVGSSKSTGSERRREDRIKKRRRRRRHSSSSASTSSDSSESSSSSTSVERRKRSKKRTPKSLTVAKKYYHKGKLVKVIKKRKKKSISPTESSESSDSDRKRKKSKYRKVIKVIKRRSETSEDSDSSSSDSDLYSRKKKKKKMEKNCRKKKRNKKKKKLSNSSETSDSEYENDIRERKKSKSISNIKKDKNDMSE